MGSDDASQTASAPAEAPEGRTIGVFLCDDVPGFRALARIALEQAPDLRVVGEASDAGSGIPAIVEAAPDAVLLDLGVPMENGLEAIPRLRAEAPDTCLIVLSGLPPDRAANPALARGAHRYLEKGVPWEAVRLAIRRCVEAYREGGRPPAPAPVPGAEETPG